MSAQLVCVYCTAGNFGNLMKCISVDVGEIYVWQSDCLVLIKSYVHMQLHKLHLVILATGFISGGQGVLLPPLGLICPPPLGNWLSLYISIGYSPRCR